MYLIKYIYDHRRLVFNHFTLFYWRDLLQKMACSLRTKKCYGGYLLCKCESRIKCVHNPEEVQCCHFSRATLDSWRKLYKPTCCWEMDLHSIITYKESSPKNNKMETLAQLNENEKLTPGELACFYGNLIKKVGRHSAAFILATSR